MIDQLLDFFNNLLIDLFGGTERWITTALGLTTVLENETRNILFNSFCKIYLIIL